MIALGVLLAGGFGAVARYLVDLGVRARVRHASPWGTFVINVSGSLGLGLVTGLVLYHGLGDGPSAVIGVGFLGAYTTFSTYAFEVVEEHDQRGPRPAIGYALGSVAAGLAAATLGLGIAGLL